MNVVYNLSQKNPPPFPVQQDPCWMLHSQHAQCNKITCCTLLHKACYWWPFSKVDLSIQFDIQQDPYDAYVDLVASGKLHTVISVVYCCIVHGTPLIDKERLGLNWLWHLSLIFVSDYNRTWKQEQSSWLHGVISSWHITNIINSSI